MNFVYKAIQLFIVFFWLAISFWVYSTQLSKNIDKVEAIKLKPLSVSNWVNLADNYHDTNSYEKRSAALRVAAKLAENRATLTQPVLYRQVAWAELQQARVTSSRLLNLDAKQTYNVFLVMKSIYGVKDFIENIIPKVLINEKHDNLTHISELISALIRNNKTIELLELWDYLSDQIKTNVAQSRYMLNHYQSLSRNKNYGLIDSLSTTPSSNRQFNGSDLVVPFTENDFQNPFCWVQGIQNNTQISRSKNILNLSLLPVNSASSTFICYIPVIVEQKVNVEISSLWASKNLNTDHKTSLSIRLIDNTNTIQPFRVIKSGNWSPEKISYKTSFDKSTLGIEIIFSMPDTRQSTSDGQISITNFNVIPTSES